MDVLKAQLARIQQQLNGLNASQKMLAATLVAIMVMTLLWWGKYSATPEMEPVLNQSLGDDYIAKITGKLAARGINYRVADGKVLVPADRKLEVLAELNYEQLLPQDVSSGYEELAKNLNPWSPPSQVKAMMNKHLEMILAGIIRGFPNVSNAVVVLDGTDERVLSARGREPVASINITTRDGQRPPNHLIIAAADTVCRAKAGLARSGITVVANGVSYPVPDREDTLGNTGGTFLEAIQTAEKYYTGKIHDHLADIQGAMVSVTVDINTQSVQAQKKTYDPKMVAKAVVRSETKTDETVSTATSAEEPGLVPNAGLALGSPAAGGEKNTATVDETVEEFENKFSEEVQSIRTPAGNATVVGASVRVPRSYFVNIFKARTGTTDKEPDDTVLKPLIDAESIKIRESVTSCLLLKQEADVVRVTTYTDVLPTLAVGIAPVATGSMTSMVSGYGKEIAVGVLAVISLFMVSMMVRKGTPQPVIIAPPEPKVTPQLQGGEDLVGEVGEGNPLLDGMELDEDAVKTQQMLTQVSTLVEENPDAAANLVKRWLNRS